MFCFVCYALPPTGLEAVLKSLYTIIDDVKRKPYDLLDYSRNQFDRDYLEFNVNIHDLEISLLVR
jgi:dynein heavy chain